MIEEWIEKLKKALELIIEVDSQMCVLRVNGWDLNRSYNYLMHAIEELEKKSNNIEI